MVISECLLSIQPRLSASNHFIHACLNVTDFIERGLSLDHNRLPKTVATNVANEATFLISHSLFHHDDISYVHFCPTILYTISVSCTLCTGEIISMFFEIRFP